MPPKFASNRLGPAMMVPAGHAIRSAYVVACLVLSATLVAVIIIAWFDVIEEGAVYRPLFKLPTCGDMLQVTAVLLDPLTVTTN